MESYTSDSFQAVDPGTTDHFLNSSVVKGRPKRCIIRLGALLFKKKSSQFKIEVLSL